MKLAVLMDSPSQLKHYKDTTIAMMERADALGIACVYFTPAEVYCTNGHAYARVHELVLATGAIKDLGDTALTEFDVILMRQDPPFDLNYIYATYALELAEQEGVLVANKPQSVRDANEKFFTLRFPQCCPPTLVSREIDRLKAFWQEHEEVIFKPLEGMGGRSVFHVGKDARNLTVILENLTKNQQVMIMAQRYIPDILATGDKRILLINGEPVPYGLARIPAKGELRGNLVAGATGTVLPLTKRDHFICSQVGPTLRAKGLYFVGIDVIGDYLTEINVTSPTCAREIMAETGIDITGEYLQFLQGMV
jgi:glutathione synthase